MLINETVVLIDSIDLFRNYVVINNLFIAVGFVNEAFCPFVKRFQHLDVITKTLFVNKYLIVNSTRTGKQNETTQNESRRYETIRNKMKENTKQHLLLA